MSAKMLVTVAICTFNRADVLRKTLEHMRGMKIPDGLDYEIIVVDNNSTDHTQLVVKEMSAFLPIRLLFEPRPGQSFARNMILREARGRLILWTDDDALVDQDWLARIAATFERTGADFVFGKVKPAWPGDTEPNWYSRRVSGLFALIDFGDQEFVATDPHKSFAGVNFGGTAAAHRQLGDFRVDFGVRGNETGGGLGEDTDMYERALASGMKVVYQPEVVVWHMIPAVRAKKMFNWKKALLNQDRYYAHIIKNPQPVPWLLGLPRYYYRKMLSDVSSLVWAFAKGDRPARFYHELHVLRFTGLFVQALRHGLRRPAALDVKRV